MGHGRELFTPRRRTFPPSPGSPLGNHQLADARRPPPLSATQGDTLIMHATNGLGDSSIGTALHTHGMFFNGSNWADGAVSTTQCPIPKDHTLTYVIDTSRQVSGPEAALGLESPC